MYVYNGGLLVLLTYEIYWRPLTLFAKSRVNIIRFSGHPNVKAFVTHGGLLGSSEAAHCAVPTVVTPMYGDQVEYLLYTT